MPTKQCASFAQKLHFFLLEKFQKVSYVFTFFFIFNIQTFSPYAKIFGENFERTLRIFSVHGKESRLNSILHNLTAIVIQEVLIFLLINVMNRSIFHNYN